MLTAFNGYIDDSGNNDIFTLSCVMAQGTNWTWFVIDWENVLEETNRKLREQGRKELSRYHAADCSSRHNEFEGWTTEEQIEFTKKLLKVFEKNSNAVTVISYSVNLNELTEEIPDAHDDPYRAAYSLVLKFLMIEIGEMFEIANKNDRGNIDLIKVALVHDRGNYDATLLHSFKSLMADPSFRFRQMFTTIAPMGWENCTPLQPADLLAYENFKESERYVVDRKRRKTLELLLSLESFGGRAKAFNRDMLRKLARIHEETKARISL